MWQYDKMLVGSARRSSMADRGLRIPQFWLSFQIKLFFRFSIYRTFNGDFFLRLRSGFYLRHDVLNTEKVFLWEGVRGNHTKDRRKWKFLYRKGRLCCRSLTTHGGSFFKQKRLEACGDAVHCVMSTHHFIDRHWVSFSEGLGV